MKAPWKISLHVDTKDYTFFIGNRYIYAYNDFQYARKKYMLNRNWKLALTVLNQSEDMVYDQIHVLHMVFQLFNCIDQKGSFNVHEFFAADDLEKARKIIDDYERIHIRERKAAQKRIKAY